VPFLSLLAFLPFFRGGGLGFFFFFFFFFEMRAVKCKCHSLLRGAFLKRHRVILQVNSDYKLQCTKKYHMANIHS